MYNKQVITVHLNTKLHANIFKAKFNGIYNYFNIQVFYRILYDKYCKSSSFFLNHTVKMIKTLHLYIWFDFAIAILRKLNALTNWNVKIMWLNYSQFQFNNLKETFKTFDYLVLYVFTIYLVL